MKDRKTLNSKALKAFVFAYLSFLMAVLLSCSSMLPMTGAVVGGGVGALGGPGTAALGSGAGMGMGMVLKESLDEGESANVAVQQVAQAVEGLGADEIRNLIASQVGEQQGFVDSLIQEVYAVIKLIILVTAFAFIAHFAYTLYRRKKGNAYKEELRELKDKIAFWENDK